MDPGGKRNLERRRGGKRVRGSNIRGGRTPRPVRAPQEALIQAAIEEDTLRKTVFGDASDAMAEFGALAEATDKAQKTADQAPWNVEAAATAPAEVEVPVQPAWVDSDDKDMKVDLAAQKRTRKLLVRDNEEPISGAALSTRLRAQYAKINPQPEWARLDDAQRAAAEEARSARQAAKHRERSQRRQGKFRAGEASEDGEEIADGRAKRSRADSEGADAGTGEEDEGPRGPPTVSPFASAAPLTLPTVGRRGAAAARTDAAVVATGQLPSGQIDVVFAGDIMRKKCHVRSAQFHPTGQLFMAAGPDLGFNLFQVNGVDNACVGALRFEDMPVLSAAFSPDGRSIVACGRRKFFYTYDLESCKHQRVLWTAFGRPERSLEHLIMPRPGAGTSGLFAVLGNAGTTLLFSQTTLQQVGTVKMNRDVAGGACFTGDGRSLVTFNSEGQIAFWDLGTRRCSHMATDYGGVGGCALALSEDGQYLATGSRSGIVSLYSAATVGAETRPQPLREFKNLQTPIDCLHFGPHAEALAMGSADVEGALRLVHTDTRTVFSNWPTVKTPIGHLGALDFSPNGGYLAVANRNKGRVILYRLNHYSRA